MNRTRRQKLEDVWSELEALVEGEQEALDNMPENLAASGVAEAMDENIETLTEAMELIREVLDI